jgi:D-beta-D-heptose 7-phosphate kinase/D-beta-D-heptose 1-phosphate adenosyltransferase
MTKQKRKIDKLHDGKSLKKKIDKLRKEGKKIVLSSGSWDMLHVGHMRYLKAAKEKGDFLVVGVDSDKKIKKRKGPDRPVVPEEERLEMLSHLEFVDALFLKKDSDKEGNLIMIVSPDILIVSESTKHDPKHLKIVSKFCQEVCTLPPQAETSTTAKIRRMHVDGKKDLVKKLMDEMPKLLNSFLDAAK